MDILKQLNDAAAYIETNLCGQVVLKELAQIACVTVELQKERKYGHRA